MSLFGSGNGFLPAREPIVYGSRSVVSVGGGARWESIDLNVHYLRGYKEGKMGIKTKIEWVDSSVNPVMGCTGCALREEHCYAASLCTRYAGRKGWPKSFDNPELFPGRLEKAMRWKDLTGSARPDKPWFGGLPRHIFVNDLSDGFCPDVDPNEWLLPCLDAMAQSPHIWLLLTKWPGRMREFFWQHKTPNNFSLGITAQSQRTADERIPILLQIPAAVRFVSVEPMLEWVLMNECFLGPVSLLEPNIEPPFLDWVICGAETGPGARLMDDDWARDLLAQCRVAGVPFFMKQVSGRGPIPDDLMVREYPDSLGELNGG